MSVHPCLEKMPSDKALTLNPALLSENVRTVFREVVSVNKGF